MCAVISGLLVGRAPRFIFSVGAKMSYTSPEGTVCDNCKFRVQTQTHLCDYVCAVQLRQRARHACRAFDRRRVYRCTFYTDLLTCCERSENFLFLVCKLRRKTSLDVRLHCSCSRCSLLLLAVYRLLLHAIFGGCVQTARARDARCSVWLRPDCSCTRFLVAASRLLVHAIFGGCVQTAHARDARCSVWLRPDYSLRFLKHPKSTVPW